MEPLIQTAREEWLKKFTEAGLNLDIRQATGMWDESLLPNWDRELPLHMLLLISDEIDASGKQKAAFAKGALWRRRGLPGLLTPLPRAEYQDWSKTISPYDRGNLDLSQERRQWVSGVPVWTSILAQAFAGMGLSPAHVCHVRDYSWGLERDASFPFLQRLVPCVPGGFECNSYVEAWQTPHWPKLWRT